MKRRFFLTLLPLLVFLGLALAFYLRIGAGDPAILPSALIGKSVPDFSLPALPNLNLPGVASTDLKKNRMTFVNVWASWCVPCRAEHPLLMLLSEQSTKDGFDMVGLNYKDQPEAALKFLSDYGNPFQRVASDPSGRFGIDWGVYGVPESFIVDGNGNIVFKHVGPLNADVFGQDILPRLQGKKR